MDERQSGRGLSLGTLPMAKVLEQAEMLANRVGKTFRGLHPRMQKQQISVFQLYDQDIPEIRCRVDWYGAEEEAAQGGGPHLVFSEYVRDQTRGGRWSEIVGRAVAERLGVPAGNLHIRQQPQGGDRCFTVREGALRFRVNLEDGAGTGLALDARLARQKLTAQAAGRRVLHLYAGTGAFAVAAAAGGAAQTVMVDASERHLRRGEENLRINGLLDGSGAGRHVRYSMEVRSFAERARRMGHRWEICVCEPPAFSGRTDAVPWDLQREHPALLRQILPLLEPGGELWLLTRHQGFVPDFKGLGEAGVSAITELTAESVPPDCRNRQAHRLWRIVREDGTTGVAG